MLHILQARDANQEILYDPDEFLGLRAQMHQDYQSMCKHDDIHPITLQTGAMMGELFTSNGQVDPFKTMDCGYQNALDSSDPAMAMHHLIFCMFQELKVIT